MEIPRIAITMGDPSGIGPEIIAATLAEPAVRQACHPVVLGDIEAICRGNDVAASGLTPIIITHPEEAATLPADSLPILSVATLAPQDMRYGHPTKAAGDAVYRTICRATDLCLQGQVGAMATAPISKASLQAAGHHYPGHTELIAERCDCNDFVMMLAGDVLRVALVTIHEPLSNVPKLITVEQVLKTITVTAQGVTPLCGSRTPKLAVMALNPHCGEQGIFGNEEIEQIIPAVAAARSIGIDVEGPFSADTFFHAAVGCSFPYDAVVAMYHDQGLIPLKMRHFDDGINITLGLPIIRTSVDHGTAYPLAGTGTANNASMRAAIMTAATLARRR